MRNCKKIKLSSGAATVLELRVCDVRQLLSDNAVGDIDVHTLLFEYFSDPLVVFSAQTALEKLTSNELEKLVEAALEVNASFFETQKTATPRNNQSQNAQDQFDKSCVLLIENGHANLENYGWQFFLAALNPKK